MMMATGFGAPLTGARRGPNRRDSWRLRLKEGRGGRKRGEKGQRSAILRELPSCDYRLLKAASGSGGRSRLRLPRRAIPRRAETDEADEHHGPGGWLGDSAHCLAGGRYQQPAGFVVRAGGIEELERVRVGVSGRGRKRLRIRIEEPRNEGCECQRVNPRPVGVLNGKAVHRCRHKRPNGAQQVRPTAGRNAIKLRVPDSGRLIAGNRKRRRGCGCNETQIVKRSAGTGKTAT